MPLDLMIDGKKLRGEFFGVEILNIPFTGPGLPLAPKADAARRQARRRLLQSQ